MGHNSGDDCFFLYAQSALSFSNSEVTLLTWLLIIARLLTYCDRVIALSQDGKVIQDGTFDTLKKIPGYINDVSEPSVEFSGSGQESSDSAKSEEPPKSENAAEAPEPEANDSKPAGTDLSVYRYYFSRINWKNTAMFLIFQVSLAVSSAFGCETIFPFCYRHLFTDNFQTFGSNGGQTIAASFLTPKPHIT